MIEARNVSVRIRQRVVLADISLRIRPGEVAAVIGPNGAGKTTLLKVLTGDARCSAGEVFYENRPLRDWQPRELAQRRAVLPQSSQLTFSFTVLEVVLMGRVPHSRVAFAEKDRAIAHEALAAVEMQDFRDRFYTTLSGGEKQRVQLARALAQIWEPHERGHRYLLLDEPTASLDLAHQHGTLEAAKRLAAQGVGVLAILHDLNLAARYADVVYVLHRGAVAAAGPPAEIVRPEVVEQVFQVRLAEARDENGGRFFAIHGSRTGTGATAAPGRLQRSP